MIYRNVCIIMYLEEIIGVYWLDLCVYTSVTYAYGYIIYIYIYILLYCDDNYHIWSL